MEFHVTMPGAIDPGAIEHAIRAVDPAALVDIDPAGPALRVAATVDLPQLLTLLNRVGYPIGRHHVVQVPSICCGGCSG